jgi:colicin import membrane protein|uniref:Lipoprotein n=2 Tax=Phyllobacteriaceae TaxID=69277 RepID=Q11DK9_CHESB
MKRTQFMASLLVALSLPGCASFEEAIREARMTDRERCASYGYFEGTEPFASCMIKLSTQRQIEAANRRHREEMQAANRHFDYLAREFRRRTEAEAENRRRDQIEVDLRRRAEAEEEKRRRAEAEAEAERRRRAEAEEEMRRRQEEAARQKPIEEDLGGGGEW